jgi:peptidoglycan-associated lipoprotein
MRAMKLFGALAALLLVVACSSTPEDTGGASGAGAVAPQPTTEVLVEETVTYAPGSQEELTALYGDRVFFATDQSDLQADARATLEGWAQWLRQYPSAILTIEGHCDERGTREYNLALGERRASAAKNYLVALGINPNRLATISYGKERPAVLGSNEFAWAQNRRGVAAVN